MTTLLITLIIFVGYLAVITIVGLILTWLRENVSLAARYTLFLILFFMLSFSSIFYIVDDARNNPTVTTKEK